MPTPGSTARRIARRTELRPPAPGRAGGEHLWRKQEAGRTVLFTAALADPPAVYGERTTSHAGRVYREWVATRSKLAAAIALGYQGRIPSESERWLYLGAATGTTVSHFGDLVGPAGAVYAVERSVRPFARLLRLSERYPNLRPILGDAREPSAYMGSVPPVDGVYMDVAQPDQTSIALQNARLMLRGDGRLLMVLKTASMGRALSSDRYLEGALGELGQGFEMERSIRLDPIHRRHFLLAGRPRPALFDDHPPRAPSDGPRPGTSGPRAGRRR